MIFQVMNKVGHQCHHGPGANDKMCCARSNLQHCQRRYSVMSSQTSNKSRGSVLMRIFSFKHCVLLIGYLSSGVDMHIIYSELCFCAKCVNLCLCIAYLNSLAIFMKAKNVDKFCAVCRECRACAYHVDPFQKLLCWVQQGC